MSLFKAVQILIDMILAIGTGGLQMYILHEKIANGRFHDPFGSHAHLPMASVIDMNHGM